MIIITIIMAVISVVQRYVDDDNNAAAAVDRQERCNYSNSRAVVLGGMISCVHYVVQIVSPTAIITLVIAGTVDCSRTATTTTTTMPLPLLLLLLLQHDDEDDKE